MSTHMHNGDQVDNWQVRSFRRAPFLAMEVTAEEELPERDMLLQMIKYAVMSIQLRNDEASKEMLWIRKRSQEAGGFGWVCDLLGLEPRRAARLLIGRMRRRRGQK